MLTVAALERPSSVFNLESVLQNVVTSHVPKPITSFWGLLWKRRNQLQSEHAARAAQERRRTHVPHKVIIRV